MDWEAIGAVGEILGAAGVIVTLLYLTAQMRQNTRALENSASESYATSVSSLNDFVASHAGLFAKAESGHGLSAEEKIVMLCFTRKVITILEANYIAHSNSAISPKLFSSRTRGFSLVLKMPHVSEHWGEIRPYCDEEVVSYVESAMRGEGT